MSTYFTNTKVGTVYKGNIKIGQIYKGSQLVYQSAFNITYMVDTNKSYVEKVIPNKTMLSPSFTPSKEGWTFVGWRKDNTASSSVLTSEVATGHTTLYAVFKQSVTCTFKSYNSEQKVSGNRYYNNGKTANATVTVPTGAKYSGWTWRGWSAAGVKTTDASVAYSNGSKISDLTSAKTYYGLYYKTYSVTTTWSCGHCGTTFYGITHPKYCVNTACANNDTISDKWTEKANTTKTDYYNAGNTTETTTTPFNGYIYAWDDDGNVSSEYYGSGYSTFDITINATKNSNKGKPPTEDGGDTYSYGYVEIVGKNDNIVTKIVGNAYDNKTNSIKGLLSTYGGSFKVRAKGWAGEVRFNGTLSK